MGDSLSKPEPDRFEPKSSSDTYFPSGDRLAAYGGRAGLYTPYPGGHSDPYMTTGPMPLSSSFSSIGPPPARGPPAMPSQSGGIFSSFSRSKIDTVIIWDWDDTLMCTTAINTGRQVSPHLDYALEDALKCSMQLGETIIVTNADDMWVFESSRRFAPRSRNILQQIQIHSARRKYESSFPGDVFAWKRETFREILQTRANGGLNLVVLGDSPAEMEAAQTSTYGLAIHPLIVKTVKFKETPGCDELIEQLRICLQELPAIVHEDSDNSRRDLAMFIRGRPYSSQQANMMGGNAQPYLPEAAPRSPMQSFSALGSSLSHESTNTFGTPPPAYHQQFSGGFFSGSPW